MTNRVILGMNGATPNFKVSKPGYDVLTTGGENLLIDGVAKTAQRILGGRVSIPAGGDVRSVTVNYTNNGFIPHVLWYSSDTNNTYTSFPCPYVQINPFIYTRVRDLTATSVVFQTNDPNASYINYVLFFVKDD